MMSAIFLSDHVKARLRVQFSLAAILVVGTTAMGGAATAASIHHVDSATMTSASSGELSCLAPGVATLTPSLRLPVVANVLTKVELRGSDLRRADYDLSVTECSGTCSVVGASGNTGQAIDVKVHLGNAGGSPVLLARHKTTNDTSRVRFNVMEAASIADVTPRDGLFVGSLVEVRGSGLTSLNLDSGQSCFDIVSKAADKIVLRSKCQQGQPAGTSSVQLSFITTGSAGGACKVQLGGKDRMAFSAPQDQPTDLTADFGPFSSFTRVDPVTPDRRVADSFCSGLNPDILESDSQCFTQGSVSQNNAQGIGNQTQCTTTAIKTQLFRRALTGKIQLTVKNASTAQLNRPFDTEIRSSTGTPLLSKRITTALNPGALTIVEFTRPVSEIGYVKVTAQSGRDFLLKYGQPGCYRAKNELAFLPAAANDYSEVEFVGVVDVKNEINEGPDGKANNTTRLLPR